MWPYTLLISKSILTAYLLKQDKVLCGDSKESTEVNNNLDILVGTLVKNVIEKSTKIITGNKEDFEEVPQWGVPPEIHIADDIEAG